MKVNDIIPPVILPSCGVGTNEFEIANGGYDHTSPYEAYQDQYNGNYYAIFRDPFGETIRVTFPSIPTSTQSFNVVSSNYYLNSGNCQVYISFTNSSVTYDGLSGQVAFVPSTSGSGFQILFCNVNLDSSLGYSYYNCKGNLVYN
jgi:hypothetical protein